MPQFQKSLVFWGVSASCRLVLRSLSAVPHSNLSQGTLDADLKDPLLIARLIEDAVDGAVVVPRPNQALQLLKFESPGSENAVEKLQSARVWCPKVSESSLAHLSR